MNNYILISKTFAEITPESCEDGDFSNTGFISECEQVSFSELVDILKENKNPSSSPNNGDINVWYSSGYYTKCYRTATDRETSIHYHEKNTPNCEKYWKLAAKFAGIKIS